MQIQNNLYNTYAVSNARDNAEATPVQPHPSIKQEREDVRWPAVGAPSAPATPALSIHTSSYDMDLATWSDGLWLIVVADNLVGAQVGRPPLVVGVQADVFRSELSG
jgi:hypothetical protein